MGGKLSAKSQRRLDVLLEGRRKVGRAYGLVEQYASTKQDHFTGLISRNATDLGRLFLNNGFGAMADHATQMRMVVRRGGVTQTKFRNLRELVGQLQGELDRAEKKVLSDDRADAAS